MMDRWGGERESIREPERGHVFISTPTKVKNPNGLRSTIQSYEEFISEAKGNEARRLG